MCAFGGVCVFVYVCVLLVVVYVFGFCGVLRCVVVVAVRLVGGFVACVLCQCLRVFVHVCVCVFVCVVASLYGDRCVFLGCVVLHCLLL